VSIVALVGAALLWRRPVPDVAPPSAAVRLGNEGCGRCHAQTMAAWGVSEHAQHMAPPSPEFVKGDFEGDNVYAFEGTRSRMFREGPAWRMEYTDPDGRTEVHDIVYALGSSRHQVYLSAEPDGRLQVLPTYWNSEEGRWRDAREGTVDGPSPTPTDAPQYWRNYGRTFNRHCMECHSSFPEKNFDATSYRYASEFDPTISCEACHGPSRGHEERWRAAPAGHDSGGTSTGLLSLGALELEPSIGICAACHALKRTYAAGFVPGDEFYDFFAPDVWDAKFFQVDGRVATLAYRFAEYMQNGCFQRSERKMDCSWCHPPHDLVSTRGRTVVESNAICTSCHLGHKTRLGAHTHHRPESEGSRCVSCHMPAVKLKIRMTVRDHTIGSPLPELTRRFGVPNACTGCHEDQPVAWAEEYVTAWYGQTEHYRSYRARLVERAETLDAVFAGRPPPVDVLISWLDDLEASLVERASAAKFLVKAPKSQAARDALLRHRKDPHPLVRFNVVGALANFPDTRYAIYEALADERRIVRVAAFESLWVNEPAIM